MFIGDGLRHVIEVDVNWDRVDVSRDMIGNIPSKGFIKSGIDAKGNAAFTIMQTYAFPEHLGHVRLQAFGYIQWEDDMESSESESDSCMTGGPAACAE